MNAHSLIKSVVFCIVALWLLSHQPEVLKRVL